MTYIFGDLERSWSIFRDLGSKDKILLGSRGNYFQGSGEINALFSGIKGAQTPLGGLTLLPNDHFLPVSPPPPLTPSRVLPVCDNCHNASTIFKNSNKTLGPRREKLCRRSLKTTKGADQPVHPRRLVSAFVIISSVVYLRHFIDYTLLRGSGWLSLIWVHG